MIVARYMVALQISDFNVALTNLDDNIVLFIGDSAFG